MTMARSKVIIIIAIAIVALVRDSHGGNVIATELSNDNNQTDLTLNTTNVDGITLTWPNGTSLKVNLTLASFKDSPVVDCFGLGKTVAKFLTWWFTGQENVVNTVDVRFFLSSRKRRRRVEVLAGDQFGLDWTDFVPERKTVIIVHGFLSVWQEDWIKEMEDALLAMEDVNVIVVDWAARANIFNYYKAVVNTKMVGTEIARFLHQIVNATIDANPSEKPQWGKLHLVGHSLGAHICGVAADRFKKRQNSWMVHRITGLDPAQPCYRNMNMSMQLDVSDAPFVDIIHTNGRLLTSLGLGQPDPIGHIDFYPNGGKIQPGCAPLKRSYVDFIPLPKSMIDQAICSHGRAHDYFTASIIAAVGNNCTFWANNWDLTYRRAVRILSEPCDPMMCAEMGIHAENYAQRGTYFALTSKSSPFCETSLQDREDVKNQMKVDYQNSLYD